MELETLLDAHRHGSMCNILESLDGFGARTGPIVNPIVRPYVCDCSTKAAGVTGRGNGQ